MKLRGAHPFYGRARGMYFLEQREFVRGQAVHDALRRLVRIGGYSKTNKLNGLLVCRLPFCAGDFTGIREACQLAHARIMRTSQFGLFKLDSLGLGRQVAYLYCMC